MGSLWIGAPPVLAETKSMLVQITNTFAAPVPMTEVHSDEPIQLAVCLPNPNTVDLCASPEEERVTVPFVTTDTLAVKWFVIEYASWVCAGSFGEGIPWFRLLTLRNSVSQFHTFRADTLAQPTTIYADAGTHLALSSDLPISCRVTLSGRLIVH
jgi:hypothetical protein